MPGALLDVKPLFCTPYGLSINMEDDILFGGVVVGFVAALEDPKSASKSSIPDEVFWPVVLDGVPSSKSINDSSFLVEVEASSWGIGFAAAA